MIKKKQPEKVWTDKRSEFKGDFKKFCEKKGTHLYTTENETKPSRRGTFDRLKSLFTNFWRKNGLGRKLKVCPSL